MPASFLARHRTICEVLMEIKELWSINSKTQELCDEALTYARSMSDKLMEYKKSTTEAVPAPSGEDDLIAAREAAAQWRDARSQHGHAKCLRAGTFDQLPEVQSALLALRSRPASALPVVGEDALTELAKHRNWELSCGEDPQIEGEMRWQVHSVNGGRNDREWTLIGTGDTPEAAIRSAIIPSVQP